MRTFALSLIVAGALFGEAPPPPRRSPEFTLNLPEGKQQLLSAMCKGKVCLVEFLFTTCSHCQHTAQMFTKLQKELGPRGLQTVGIAFNPMASMLTPDFIRDYASGFPVAWSNREPVLGFLSVSEIERFVVPQVVIIDRKGMIRAQSPPLGDPKLQDEANLRVVLDGLLKEAGGPAAPAAVKPAAGAKVVAPIGPAAKKN